MKPISRCALTSSTMLEEISVEDMYHCEKREGRAYRRARASSNGEGAAQIPLANATENTTD